jgi:tRNA U38,U39,U40 pseudouridine synthase TruA
VVDLATVRRIAWLCISQSEEVLPQADVDDDLQQRPAYQEGILTDQPDLTIYDQLFEDENEEQNENRSEEEDKDGDQPF